jgi:hypothetical protein
MLNAQIEIKSQATVMHFNNVSGEIIENGLGGFHVMVWGLKNGREILLAKTDVKSLSAAVEFVNKYN